jgi:hypothetical protein
MTYLSVCWKFKDWDSVNEAAELFAQLSLSIFVLLQKAVCIQPGFPKCVTICLCDGYGIMIEASPIGDEGLSKASTNLQIYMLPKPKPKVNNRLTF